MTRDHAHETGGTADSNDESDVSFRERWQESDGYLLPFDSMAYLPVVDQFTRSTATVTDAEARRWRDPDWDGEVVRIIPTDDDHQPTDIAWTVQGLREAVPGLLQQRNNSPIFGVELVRPRPDALFVQYPTPDEDFAERLKLLLSQDLSGIRPADTGRSGLPVKPGDSVAATGFNTSRDDWLPLATDVDRPPLAAVARQLHRHRFRHCRCLVQILWKPLAGRQLLEARWQRKAEQYIESLVDADFGTGTTRRRHAREAEQKLQEPLYQVTVRIITCTQHGSPVGPARELTSAFNMVMNGQTSQALEPRPVEFLYRRNIARFCRATADRRIGLGSHWFRATADEVGTLVAPPTNRQENLRHPSV